MSNHYPISIVGAGPGDPELLTIKAFKRLKKADIVFHDVLISTEILELSNKEAELVYVGKLFADGQDQAKRQDLINRSMKEAVREGKRVVRLKAGDPMIFGRGYEELEFCLRHDLEVEMIPGITAGIAAASGFGIPLTIRGKNSMCLLYTGHQKDGGFSDLDTLTLVLQSNASVIVYMGLTNLSQLSKKLVDNGIQPGINVQILSNVSQPEQQAYSTTIGEVDTFLSDKTPAMPALIMFGKYAETNLGVD